MHKVSNFPRWFGRGLAMLIILFFILMTFDAESFLGWIMHMLPALVIGGALLISWYHERAGSIVFVALGLVTVFFFNTYEEWLNFVTISLPFILVGISFFVSDYLMIQRK